MLGIVRSNTDSAIGEVISHPSDKQNLWCCCVRQMKGSVVTELSPYNYLKSQVGVE